MAENISTLAQTALPSSLNSSQTTFVVTNGKFFPVAPVFRVRVDDELMKVTGVSGLNWTVVRGTEGSLATSHAAGTIVRGVLTPESLVAVIQQQMSVALIGPIASRPSTPGSVSNTYYSTDHSVLSVSDGSAWTTYGPLCPFTPPPTVLTPVNMLGSYDFAGGLAYIISNTVGGENMRILLKSLPLPPFTVTICFASHLFDCNYSQSGVCVQNSSTGQLLTMTNLYGRYMETQRFNSPTSYNSTPVSLAYRFNNRLRWYRYSEDASNRYMSYSTNGVTYQPLMTEARTAFTTVDRIGFFVNYAPSATLLSSITVYGWETTTP